MEPVKVTIHGAITYGANEDSPADTLHCPICRATHAHTVRGSLTDASVPVTLTCVSGHDVPVPDWLDTRDLLFTAAMRSE